MKALVWEAPRQITLHDQPQPEAAEGEVLIKVAYAGICGSELSGYLGESSLRVPPLVMGHEFAGDIVSLGANVSQKNPNLKTGQTVTVNPLTYCGVCDYCQQGLNQLCMNRRLIGAHRPGAFAEYVPVPAYLARPLPEGMEARMGALTEPAACAVRAAELAGDIQGDSCLVIGAGPIGLLTMQALLLNGAEKVFIAEIDPQRLAMGEALGGIPINPRQQDTVQVIREATGSKGVPVSVDAVGSAVTRKQCLLATRTTGHVVFIGLHEEISTLPVAEIVRREIQVKGTYAYSPANFAQALDLLAQGKIRLDPWIVEAPLAEGGKWFDTLLDAPGDVAKVLLIP